MAEHQQDPEKRAAGKKKHAEPKAPKSGTPDSGTPEFKNAEPISHDVSSHLQDNPLDESKIVRNADSPAPFAGNRTEYGGLKDGLAADGWTFQSRLRLFLIFLFSLLIIPPHWLVMRLVPIFWWPGAGLWHRTMAWVIGIRVVEQGDQVKDRPVVFVANHISWIDILVLGGKLKYASFVAKAQIQSWGIVGSICALHRTIFVNRERRSDSAAQANRLTERVRTGSSLIFFPEATSTLGTEVFPFKSSLFSVAERADDAFPEPIKIQPITISYSRVDGMPMIRARRKLVGWVGDIELLDHVVGVLNTGRIVATITYHDPVTLADLGGRKKLAAHCEQVIRTGLEAEHRADRRIGRQPR